jgi:hypothetical protein
MAERLHVGGDHARKEEYLNKLLFFTVPAVMRPFVFSLLSPAVHNAQ